MAAIQGVYPAVRSHQIHWGRHRKTGRAANQGTLYLHLYDENLEEFAQIPQDIEEMKDGELTDIPVNLKLEAGRRYYLGILCEDYGMRRRLSITDVFVGETDLRKMCILLRAKCDRGCQRKYTVYLPDSLTLSQILFYDSLILLLGVCVLRTGKRAGREKGEKSREEHV